MRNSRLDLAERELERVLVIANNNGLPGLTHDQLTHIAFEACKTYVNSLERKEYSIANGFSNTSLLTLVCLYKLKKKSSSSFN